MSQALISVFEKKGVLEFAQALAKIGIRIISTGGTSKTLADNGVPVTSVSDVTQFPEVLEGRVKTLHPNIHAAILARREKENHLKDLDQHKIKPIDLVAVNLYPFSDTIAKPNTTLDDALEMIDIGGVALIRASAKNFRDVVIVVDPADYSWIIDRLSTNNGNFGSITIEERKKLALKAFQHVVSYDTAIANYLATTTNSAPTTTTTTTTTSQADKLVVREYQHEFNLKYGVNPHQVPAAVYSIKGLNLPFRVLNGTPGYINFMDALNAWQLVKELRQATNLAAAASFKHVSPAGAAVAVELTAEERSVYEIAADKKLTPSSIAYIRARQADPMCSYGDFAALSDVVDEATAEVLKTEVSDGIIAPGFDEKALEILRAKKGGNYIVIQINPDYEATDMEYREVYGVVFSQKRNTALITKENFTKVLTNEKSLSSNAILDLMVATITLKYTQSNSVGFAINGQMVGVGAGQQSRVDCSRLAGEKVKKFHLRFHPKVRSLPFKQGTKRVDKTNARVHYIENDLAPTDIALFEGEKAPEPLTAQEKNDWMKTLRGLSMSSDAFFPFRDSIDVAAKIGVQYVAQPGGSIQDEGVTQACNEYGMIMAVTGVRLFHH